jgi:hypothetical protein
MFFLQDNGRFNILKTLTINVLKTKILIKKSTKLAFYKKM